MDLNENILSRNRELLKTDWWKHPAGFVTDQQKGMPRPQVEKPIPEGAETVDLVPVEEFTMGDVPVGQVIAQRRSHRWFKDKPLSLEELSYLLWATQGIRMVSPDGERYYRNVPSGGNRHPFETYVSVHNVSSLKTGLYRYLPIEHQLVTVRIDPEIAIQVREGSLNQSSMVNGEHYFFVERSAVTFIWTANPYRTEWRYGPAAAKLIALDAGHMCQNLYIACGAIGAGTVAMGAFDEDRMNQVLGVDGEKEFVIYMAPVGIVQK